MGFFDAVKTLISGGEISFEKTTHINTAKNLLTEDRQNYVGEWQGASTNLLIRNDGTVDYRREQTVGDMTNTDSVSGPINAFHEGSFMVGALGQNTQFDVSQSPRMENDTMTMTVNGERLEKR